MLPGMSDSTLTTDLGRVLVTGGSGFVGANLVTELLDRGHEVRSFDRASSPLPAHPRLEVVEGDATALDFAADRFSSATSFFMLHHVPTPELQDQLFAEVVRVLRPGGVFIAADSMGSDGLREFHHDDVYQPIDPAGLADRLRTAGFVDVEVSVYQDQGWNATGYKPG